MPLPPSALAVLRDPRLLTRESLAGVVTVLALVPEVISFSVIAGVDPQVSLVASVVLLAVTTVLGGRPAMVTAAAGSVALVIAPLVHAHGTAYVLPAVVLGGLVQVAFGALGLARLMRFVPRSVMIGFVNALGVLIFAAQVPHLIGVPWAVYPLFAASIAIVLLLPRLTTAVPAALVAIVVVTGVVVLGGIAVPTVGDEGTVSGALPGLTPLGVPLDATTLSIVWPTAVSVAFVGLMETLLTAKLVDGLTGTPSRKNRESWGLGVANVGAALWGGIGGCAMIGQTIVNVRIGGGRTRVSTGVAALFLLALLTALGPVMAAIPMVSLAAVMMVVAVTTVDWRSLRPSTLRRMPVPETAVMAVTVAVVLVTSNLAVGVGIGVLMAMVLFARRVARGTGVSRTVEAGVARYEVRGPLFFGSSSDLVDRFSYADDPAEAVVDLTHAQVWDASTVAVLDAIEQRYADHGRRVRFEGLDERSTAFHSRLTGRLGQ